MSWSIENTDPKARAAKCSLFSCCLRDEAEARRDAVRIFRQYPHVTELELEGRSEIHPTGSVSMAGEKHSRIVGNYVGGDVIRRINMTATVLHLWKPLDAVIPMPPIVCV